MREGWRKLPLGELCTITLGGTPPRANPAYFDKERQSGHVWLSIADLPANGRSYVTVSKEHLSDSGAERVRLVPAGTLLLSFKLSIGRVAVAGVPLRTNEAIAALANLKENLISREYLFWHLRSYDWKSATHGEDKLKGVTLNSAKLKLLPVLLPPLDEQKRIVAVLDEADEAITTATALTEHYMINVRELRDLTSEKLFSEASHSSDKITLEDALALGWLTGHLDGNHGSSYPRKEEFVKSGIPYVSANCIVDGEIDLNRAKYLTAERADAIRKGIACDGDLIFAHNATVGPVAVLRTSQPKVVLSTSVTFYRCNPDRVNVNYLKYFMMTPRFVVQYEAVMRQSTRNQVPITAQRTFTFMFPSLEVQTSIAIKIEALETRTKQLLDLLQNKHAALGRLRDSIFASAFSGELTAVKVPSLAIVRANDNDFTTAEQVANVIAFAQRRHVTHRQQLTFGHKKAQKVLHLIEAVSGVELGRRPYKDAGGPNDFSHMLAAERWAKANRFFEFVREGDRYTFRGLSEYAARMSSAETALAPIKDRLERATALVVDLDSRKAEVLATVHAAWNNLVLDGYEPTEEAIVRVARDEWHPDKLLIPVSEFRQAIREIRKLGIVPDGSAKRVGEPRLL